MALSPRRYGGLLLLGLTGAALLAIPAAAYRVDRFSCTQPPSLLTNVAAGAVYWLGIALLFVVWRQLTAALRDDPQASQGPVLGGGLLVHLAALGSPPFLSNDPLCYAAIGRAIARFGQSPYLPVNRVLPPGDPFLILLPARWQTEPGAYSRGWNWIAAAIAHVGGDSLNVQLKLYQLLGLVTIVTIAYLAGRLSRRPAYASALVLFCPLAVTEATIGGHNDILLALTVALFAYAWRRRQPVAALLCLASGLLIKDSAVLLCGLVIGGLSLGWLLPRLGFWRLGLLGLLGLLGALLALVAVAPLLSTYSPTLDKLLGGPAQPFEFCVRSIECVPRIVLRHAAGSPLGAWLVNLSFRLASVGFLLYCAFRAQQRGDYLRWAGSFLFLYYLYLHGYSQSWYLLSLLPLLPDAEPRYLPAMSAFVLSATLYYPLDWFLRCDSRPLAIGVVQLGEILLVILPPTLLLRRAWIGEKRVASPQSVVVVTDK